MFCQVAAWPFTYIFFLEGEKEGFLWHTLYASEYLRDFIMIDAYTFLCYDELNG